MNRLLSKIVASFLIDVAFAVYANRKGKDDAKVIR